MRPFVCPEEIDGKDASKILALYYDQTVMLNGDHPLIPDMLPGFEYEYPISGLHVWSTSAHKEEGRYMAYAEVYIHYNTANALTEQLLGSGITQSQEELEKTAYSADYQRGFFIYTGGDGSLHINVRAYTYLGDGLYYVQIKNTEWGDDPDAMRLIVEKNENAKWGFYVKSVLRSMYGEEDCIIQAHEYTHFLRRGNPEITRRN